MPVNIYRLTPDDQENEEVAWLCDDVWLIRPQIEALSTWLEQSSATLQPADYIADVGFQWRRDALAGGPVLDPTAMRRMADLGMWLYLSEYPGFADELTDDAREGEP
jgi:hypothetical protein